MNMLVLGKMRNWLMELEIDTIPIVEEEDIENLSFHIFTLASVETACLDKFCEIFNLGKLDYEEAATFTLMLSVLNNFFLGMEGKLLPFLKNMIYEKQQQRNMAGSIAEKFAPELLKQMSSSQGYDSFAKKVSEMFPKG